MIEKNIKNAIVNVYNSIKNFGIRGVGRTRREQQINDKQNIIVHYIMLRHQ